METTVPAKAIDWLKSLFTPSLPNKHLYTPELEVLDELERRSSDTELSQKIVRSVKVTDSIQTLLDGGCLVMFRQVVTPLHEILHFSNLAKNLNLKPVIIEFHADKFVSTGNFYKKSLGKLPIHVKSTRNNHDVYEYTTIVDFNSNVGKPFKDIKTVKGESLIDFHHELFTYITNVEVANISLECSDWFDHYKSNAAEYYEPFLTCFTQKNVLAEVFLWGKQHGEFTKKIVTPAFNRVKQKTGYAPLILNYQPIGEQDRIYWDCYPNQTNDFLERKGYI